MLVVLTSEATTEQRESVLAEIRRLGLSPRLVATPPIITIGGRSASGAQLAAIRNLAGVTEVLAEVPPFPLASRALHSERSRVEIGGVIVGSGEFVIFAGPCAVESEEQAVTIARAVAAAGGHILRGGAYKPRTSPYSFQGLGPAGLKILAAAGHEAGLPVVSEALDEASLELVAEWCDMIQVGSRNMQNYALLRACGRMRKPVLVKRGMAATVEEWLLAAEYVLAEGNPNVVLCERGIRTFSDHTRNTLDLAAVLEVHALSHLPVIVDPSHGTGQRSKVVPMARAAAAVGADGVMIEVHHDPDHALSDGVQAILPAELADLITGLADCIQLAPRPERRAPARG
ncbi:MAG: 3-deoxy-7-phosphoheptulonate synthase [Acidobacteria bacterium]|nr:3-deoxy-7-phosphoheptulonate synthase [Acidobacteriota bacterium]